MNVLNRAIAALTLSLLFWAGSVAAHDFLLGDVKIAHPWSRELPAVATTGIAYFEVENQRSVTVSIVAASTPVAERASLHSHVMKDGMMSMAPVAAVEVPAGETVALEPGGLHVMLTGLNTALAADASFPLRLEFANGEQMEVTVNVVATGDEPESAKANAMEKEMKH